MTWFLKFPQYGIVIHTNFNGFVQKWRHSHMINWSYISVAQTWCHGAISTWTFQLSSTCIRIFIMKKRWSYDHIFFLTGIPVPGDTVYIERGPWKSCHGLWKYTDSEKLWYSNTIVYFLQHSEAVSYWYNNTVKACYKMV